MDPPPARGIRVPFVSARSRATIPRSTARHEAALLEEREDALRARLDVLARGVDDELRRGQLLVGSADPGELRDLPGARLLVEALRVALLADLDGRVHVDLDEVALLHDRAHAV